MRAAIPTSRRIDPFGPAWVLEVYVVDRIDAPPLPRAAATPGHTRSPATPTCPFCKPAVDLQLAVNSRKTRLAVLSAAAIRDTFRVSASARARLSRPLCSQRTWDLDTR